MGSETHHMENAWADSQIGQTLCEGDLSLQPGDKWIVASGPGRRVQDPKCHNVSSVPIACDYLSPS
jgi:hypothetical protein